MVRFHHRFTQELHTHNMHGRARTDTLVWNPFGGEDPESVFSLRRAWVVFFPILTGQIAEWSCMMFDYFFDLTSLGLAFILPAGQWNLLDNGNSSESYVLPVDPSCQLFRFSLLSWSCFLNCTGLESTGIQRTSLREVRPSWHFVLTVRLYHYKHPSTR